MGSGKWPQTEERYGVVSIHDPPRGISLAFEKQPHGKRWYVGMCLRSTDNGQWPRETTVFMLGMN